MNILRHSRLVKAVSCVGTVYKILAGDRDIYILFIPDTQRVTRAGTLCAPLQVLLGMVLVGIGTFFAQASATGFVGQAARDSRGVASGTYLACYFFGGTVGSAVLGQLFDHFGWMACVAGVGSSLAVAAILTARLNFHQTEESANVADNGV